MRSLLVTGGAGFIGANFAHYWAARYPQDRLVVLDALTYAGRRENLRPLEGSVNFRFVEGDICDQTLVAQILGEEGIDIVVHLAAESHVDRSIAGPDAFIRTNIIGTHALLKAAKDAWLDGRTWKPGVRFHHVSTDEVFGSLGHDDSPFVETTPYAPNSPYSASKAASDHLVRAYCKTYGLPVTVSNCSNNYGPFQHPEKLIPLMVTHAIKGLPLPVYGKGVNVRDWLHVEDHCRALEAIILHGRCGETYNVGGDCEVRNIDLVSMLCDFLDELRPDSEFVPHRQLISFVEDRPGHDLRYAIDHHKLTAKLGWRPEITLAAGLRDVVRSLCVVAENSIKDEG